MYLKSSAIGGLTAVVRRFMLGISSLSLAPTSTNYLFLKLNNDLFTETVRQHEHNTRRRADLLALK